LSDGVALLQMTEPGTPNEAASAAKGRNICSATAQAATRAMNRRFMPMPFMTRTVGLFAQRVHYRRHGHFGMDAWRGMPGGMC
jgi:hypothetical protein